LTVQIQMRYDPDSGMILIDLGELHAALHPKDALAMCAGLAGIVSQIPAMQPESRPQLVIAGPRDVPPYGGRLNGSR
jgi:hypothetical protein